MSSAAERISPEGPAAPGLAETIGERWSEHIRSKIRVSAHPTNRASNLGDRCARRLVLWRTEGHKARPPSETLQSIFEQGNMIEPAVKRTLSEMGFDIVGAQSSFPPNRYQITGHVDAVMLWHGDRIVLEIKTINGYDFDAIETAEDVARAGKGWLAKWYDQVQLYMYLADVREAVLTLYSKATGEIKAIPFGLDLERVEALLDRAEVVNDHVAAGTLPGFIQDAAECKRCPFFGVACAPPLDYGPGAQLITDEALIELAERREATAEAAAEHEAADKRLKEALRGVELGIMGDFQVTGKWQRSTKYEIPDHVKTLYKFTDDHGRFLMKIERIEP